MGMIQTLWTGILVIGALCLAGCPLPVAGDKGATNAPAGNGDHPDEESVPAGVGVGRKGHSYGGDPITAPAAAYWRTNERIIFEIEIPRALQFYKALEGEGPADHDEFMKKIVEANQLTLPDLPDNKRYRYDPETETLMVDTVSSEPGS